MSFWKKKKYCTYCGSEVDKSGSCSNEKCIAHKESTAEEKKEDSK